MAIIDIVTVRPNAAHVSWADWRSGVCNAVEGVDLTTPEPDLFGELLALDFAGARMYYVHSGNQRIFRPKPSPRGRFAPMAAIQLDGGCRVTQFGRRWEQGPGSFSYLDAAAPLVLEHESTFRCLYLQFPYRSFSRSQFHGAVGVPMGHTDLDRTFYDCATRVWDHAAELHPLEFSSALNALISLSGLTEAFRCRDENAAVPVRVSRAMAFIENNLGEEWLTPDTVAEAQRISRRYLDGLFGYSGFRIERWIWERRLIRSMEELRLYGKNSGHAQKSIVQIALDVGFKSPSHFSRTFAKRFGVSPRQYKKQLIGGDCH